MDKKIAPALWHLWRKKNLPLNSQIIGVARRSLSDLVFRKQIAKSLDKVEGRIGQKDLDKFLNLFSYHQGNFNNLEDWGKLGKRLGQLDREWQVCANKLFYIATPPTLYRTIFENLAHSGIAKPCGTEEGWTRIIVEKPFGHDLKTAEELDNLLGKLFREDQIYRLDHYLAKEMIQNILAFRFSNNLLEDSWNRKYVERIDVRLLEKEGVEGRGDTYDPVGALKDVGQNHLLQMLSLVTMDNPKEFAPIPIRKKRLEIFQKLQRINLDAVAKHTTRGQYKGYRKVGGVKPKSTTETHFKIKTHINSARWRGVPIYLESGKRIEKNRKEIIITFRPPEYLLCPPGDVILNNKIIFSLEPTEKIIIQFWAKKPGLKMELERRTFRFSYRRSHDKDEKAEEYEKLILDCLAGDQTLYVSTQEVRAMWRFIDPIIEGWQRRSTSLEFYQPDSNEILDRARQKLG